MVSLVKPYFSNPYFGLLSPFCFTICIKPAAALKSEFKAAAGFHMRESAAYFKAGHFK